MNKNGITISDVAEALDMSKTTVSRAISGKGRISEATREKVMKYIKENNYIPNPMAKGLAQSKTYNICWATPGDALGMELPFFQNCMQGILNITSRENYDILQCMIYENDISQLKRIVANRKADGVILGRTLIGDKGIEFLKENEIPFVVIGSTDSDDVVQVDNDHVRACRELTSTLIMKGIKKFSLIGSGSNHIVNVLRYNGFTEALKENKIPIPVNLIFMDNKNNADVEKAVERAVKSDAECILCMDDWICSTALFKLIRDKIAVPEKIKIASFYNSPLLSEHPTSVTSLQYNPFELGSVAGDTLFKIIKGKPVENKIILGYEVILKASTL